jgi:Flp pilus assembly pilin Flp
MMQRSIISRDGALGFRETQVFSERIRLTIIERQTTFSVKLQAVLNNERNARGLVGGKISIDGLLKSSRFDQWRHVVGSREGRLAAPLVGIGSLEHRASRTPCARVDRLAKNDWIVSDPNLNHRLLPEGFRMSIAAVYAFVRREDAATAVEYAVIIGLILLTIITVIGSVGGAASGIWGNDVNKIQSATSSAAS